MCRPDLNRQVFYSKGAAKGWSEARVERAWNAHMAQSAKEDARALIAAAPPPKPFCVGDRATHAEGLHPARIEVEILHIEGKHAWVRPITHPIPEIRKGFVTWLENLERAK